MIRLALYALAPILPLPLVPTPVICCCGAATALDHIPAHGPLRWLLLRQICLLVCELTIKGGWAGANIAPASEAPERARRAPDARRGYGG